MPGPKNKTKVCVLLLLFAGLESAPLSFDRDDKHVWKLFGAPGFSGCPVLFDPRTQC